MANLKLKFTIDINSLKWWQIKWWRICANKYPSLYDYFRAAQHYSFCINFVDTVVVIVVLIIICVGTIRSYLHEPNKRFSQHKFACCMRFWDYMLDSIIFLWIRFRVDAISGFTIKEKELLVWIKDFCHDHGKLFLYTPVNLSFYNLSLSYFHSTNSSYFVLPV